MVSCDVTVRFDLSICTTARTALPSLRDARDAPARLRAPSRRLEPLHDVARARDRRARVVVVVVASARRGRRRRRRKTSRRFRRRVITTVVSSVLGAVASASLALALSACPGPALAEAGQKPPPVRDMPGGCTIEALDLFKDTRAKFSLEVGTGALPEAILDLGGCDYSGADLDGKVLSGAIMSGANFEGAIFTGGEASRAKAVGTNFRGSVLRGTNFYEVSFAGADLRGADFDNAILTNARFGRDGGGNWAQLDGVNWEGALLSSSDAQRACENPTVDDYGRAILGCR